MANEIDLGIPGLGEYKEIGRGGFAVVYSARQYDFERLVAVKVLTSLDDAGLRRFNREKLSLGAVNAHPNIVTPYNAGFTEPQGQPYLMMEHLAGGSLQDHIDDNGPLEVNEAIDYTLQIADALRHAHNAGVLHKDIKPANILLTGTGDAKLADFGIAAIREATASAAIAWSLAYAPPESFDTSSDPTSHDDPRDERSDLYSLAATLYTLVVGRDPFYHPTNNGLPGYMARILTNPAPECDHPGLDPVLATAMVKNPADRYQTAGQLIQALKAATATDSATTTEATAMPVQLQTAAETPMESTATTSLAPFDSPVTCEPPGNDEKPRDTTEAGVATSAIHHPNGPTPERSLASQDDDSRSYRRWWLSAAALGSILGMLVVASNVLNWGTDDPTVRGDEMTTERPTDTGSETSESDSQSVAEALPEVDSEPEVSDEVVAQESSDPIRGGNLVISWTSDIASLDPIASSSFNTQYRVAPVYQRLVTFDSGPDVGFTESILKPQLATDWDISADGLTYTFKLRDGIRWQNIAPVNGRQFNSGDVKATFEAILSEGHQGNLLERVESVEAPDDLTVVLSLSAPFAPLLNNMANHFMWILPAEAFTDESYDRTSMAIGTGPFILNEREVDVSTKFVANPDYWEMGFDGEPLPYLDSFEMSVIAETTQAAVFFQAGETQLLTNSMTTDLLDQLKQDYPDAVYTEYLDVGMGQIGVNMAREPFDDLRVRQAISMAVDRATMGEAIRGGGTIPSNVAPALAQFALPEAERSELLPYDPERAKELLAEAGYPDGLAATMIATDRYGALYTAQTEWVVEDLRAVGINVELELLDYPTYFAVRWPDVDYDLQFGPQTPFLEPDEWLRGQMGSGQGRNWFNLNDPDLDVLLEEQLGLVDEGERVAKIQDIQRYALENVMNPIPIWTYLSRWAYAPEVRDFYRHASYGFNGIEKTWLAPH